MIYCRCGFSSEEPENSLDWLKPDKLTTRREVAILQTYNNKLPTDPDNITDVLGPVDPYEYIRQDHPFVLWELSPFNSKAEIYLNSPNNFSGHVIYCDLANADEGVKDMLMPLPGVSNVSDNGEDYESAQSELGMDSPVQGEEGNATTEGCPGVDPRGDPPSTPKGVDSIDSNYSEFNIMPSAHLEGVEQPISKAQVMQALRELIELNEAKAAKRMKAQELDLTLINNTEMRDPVTSNKIVETQESKGDTTNNLVLGLFLLLSCKYQFFLCVI